MKKGDKIHYIKVTKKGKGFSMSQKTGTFIEEVKKGLCGIKSTNGTMVYIRTDLVTPIDEKNALTKALS